MYNTLEELDTALNNNWKITIDNHMGTRFTRSNSTCWMKSTGKWQVAQLIDNSYAHHTEFDSLIDALKYYPSKEA